jgi:poly(3-hydroxybutyrate) depolymerase
MWKGLHGCGGARDVPGWTDRVTVCEELCAAPGQLQLCKMKGIGHELQRPFKGYPFRVALLFFIQHMGPKTE